MNHPVRLSLLTLALVFGSIGCAATAGPLRKSGDATSHHEIRSGGDERSYELYRPDGLKGPAPLVIMLHGGGGNGANGVRMTGFNDLAGREGFVVAYPNGSGRTRLLTWNAGHCCAYAMREDVDDVRFLSDLIDDLVSRGVADPKRVYVTGMSNGAMMTYRAGRELSGKIAGIAPVVGAMFGDERPAAGPVPTLIITGAKDGHVPLAGGNGNIGRRNAPNDVPYAPAAYSLNYWMAQNGCKGDARVETTPVYTLRRGTSCAASTSWYLLTEGEHAWPGGQKGSKRGDAPVTDFDASEVIWAFFKTQSR